MYPVEVRVKQLLSIRKDLTDIPIIYLKSISSFVTSSRDLHQGKDKYTPAPEYCGTICYSS